MRQLVLPSKLSPNPHPFLKRTGFQEYDLRGANGSIVPAKLPVIRIAALQAPVHKFRKSIGYPVSSLSLRFYEIAMMAAHDLVNGADAIVLDVQAESLCSVRYTLCDFGLDQMLSKLRQCVADPTDNDDTRGIKVDEPDDISHEI